MLSHVRCSARSRYVPVAAVVSIENIFETSAATATTTTTTTMTWKACCRLIVRSKESAPLSKAVCVQWWQNQFSGKTYNNFRHWHLPSWFQARWWSEILGLGERKDKWMVSNRSWFRQDARLRNISSVCIIRFVTMCSIHVNYTASEGKHSFMHVSENQNQIR